MFWFAAHAQGIEHDVLRTPRDLLWLEFESSQASVQGPFGHDFATSPQLFNRPSYK
jgi:hypothetical protein